MGTAYRYTKKQNTRKCDSHQLNDCEHRALHRDIKWGPKTIDKSPCELAEENAKSLDSHELADCEHRYYRQLSATKKTVKMVSRLISAFLAITYLFRYLWPKHHTGTSNREIEGPGFERSLLKLMKEDAMEMADIGTLTDFVGKYNLRGIERQLSMPQKFYYRKHFLQHLVDFEGKSLCLVHESESNTDWGCTKAHQGQI